MHGERSKGVDQGSWELDGYARVERPFISQLKFRSWRCRLGGR